MMNTLKGGAVQNCNGCKVLQVQRENIEMKKDTRGEEEMFCENCGNRMNDTDLFCANCGWKVEDPEQFLESDQVSQDSYGQTQILNEQEQSNIPQEANESVENEQQQVGNTVSLSKGETNNQDIVGLEKEATEVNSMSDQYVAPDQAIEPDQYVAPDQFIESEQNGTENQIETLVEMQPTAKKNIIQAILGLKTGIKIAIGGGVAILVLVIILLANLANITNFVMKTFSSPEDYLHYVEKKDAEKTADDLAMMYQNLLLSKGNVTDMSFEVSASAKLGDKAKDLLEDYADSKYGIDEFDWLNNASISGKYNIKNDVLSLEAKSKVGKTDILSGEIIFDIAKGDAYISVPELLEKYIRLDGDMYRYNTDDVKENLDMMSKMYKEYPKKDVIKKLAYKYFCIAIDRIEDVDKDSTEIDVKDITQKCTVLKSTINEECMLEIEMAIIDEMKKDKELEKIFKELAQADKSLDADEMYEEFQNEVIDALNVLENEMVGYDGSYRFVMYTYVAGNGDICGREFKVKDGKEVRSTYTFLMPEKGNKFGLEISTEKYGTKVKLEGQGKKQGEKLTGEFKVKEDNKKVLEFETKNFDLASLRKGLPNGNIKITSIGDLGPLQAFFKYDIDITMKTSANSWKYDIIVGNGDDELLTLNFNASQGKGSKVSIPSDKKVIKVDDEEELMEALEDIKLNKLLSNLKKAKVPSDITEYIEDELSSYID